MWEAGFGRELVALAGHSGEVIERRLFDRRSPAGKRQYRSVGQAVGHGIGLRHGQPRPGIAHAQGHTDVIDCVAFSPDGRRIATSSRDRTVKIWEAALPQQVTAWHNEENAAALDLPSVQSRSKEMAH